MKTDGGRPRRGRAQCEPPGERAAGAAAGAGLGAGLGAGPGGCAAGGRSGRRGAEPCGRPGSGELPMGSVGAREER